VLGLKLGPAGDTGIAVPGALKVNGRFNNTGGLELHHFNGNHLCTDQTHYSSHAKNVCV